MNKLKAGFYTAIGTPLDAGGDIIESSLRRQIDMQIEAGASGLLLLGSRGMQAAVKIGAWAEAARIAADHVNGRVSLFVSGNSVFLGDFWTKVVKSSNCCGQKSGCVILKKCRFCEKVCYSRKNERKKHRKRLFSMLFLV